MGRGTCGDRVMSFSAGGNSVSVTIPFTARFTPGAQQTGWWWWVTSLLWDWGEETLLNRADSKNPRTCRFLTSHAAPWVYFQQMVAHRSYFQSQSLSRLLRVRDIYQSFVRALTTKGKDLHCRLINRENVIILSVKDESNYPAINSECLIWL